MARLDRGDSLLTPDGSYTPFRMELMHYSREWDNAGMPHAIFFTQRANTLILEPSNKAHNTNGFARCVKKIDFNIPPVPLPRIMH